MLYLISLGLFDEQDISLRALEAARKCSKLYVEFYTTGMHTTLEKLSQLTGKPVQEIDRSGLEVGSGILLEEARKKDIGVLVGGDSLSATTHISLLLDARKKGIETRVIHGSSILTAVAESGLQLYKFGRAVTLTREKPPSIYEAIRENKKSGLHTLVLLDIGMKVEDALTLLLEMESLWKKGLVKPESRIIALCQLGGDSSVRYGPVRALLEDKSLNKTPAVLVVPGKMHFLEKEYLEGLSKA